MADELRDYIHALADRLADEEPGRVLANLIRLRLKLAATRAVLSWAVVTSPGGPRGP